MTATKTTLKASELRIGNYVRNYKWEIVKIDSSFFCGSGYAPTDIELTPEILEKAGFEKIGSIWLTDSIDICRKNNDFYFCIYNSEGELDPEIGFYEIYHDNKITSVHQLQNLYFALTGQELEINL